MKVILSLNRGGINRSLILLVVIIALLIYGLVNWQKSGKIFGFSPYKNVELIDLLSYANLYSEKRVCTRGYYVQTDRLSIIKVSLDEDEFTRSAWVKNEGAEEIILRTPYLPEKSVEAKICGYFQSRRAGEFGEPPVWNHQITVEKFETFGEAKPLVPFK